MIALAHGLQTSFYGMPNPSPCIIFLWLVYTDCFSKARQLRSTTSAKLHSGVVLLQVLNFNVFFQHFCAFI
jgi:hypothetical protein